MRIIFTIDFDNSLIQGPDGSILEDGPRQVADTLQSVAELSSLVENVSYAVEK